MQYGKYQAYILFIANILNNVTASCSGLVVTCPAVVAVAVIVIIKSHQL